MNGEKEIKAKVIVSEVNNEAKIETKIIEHKKEIPETKRVKEEKMSTQVTKKVVQDTEEKTGTQATKKIERVKETEKIDEIKEDELAIEELNRAKEEKQDIQVIEKLNTAKEEEKDLQINEKIGIPLWIVYGIFFILIGFIIFIAYEIYNKDDTEETVIQNPQKKIILQTKISIDENTIDVGETLNIIVEDFNETTYLESSNPKIINIENYTIIGIAEGEATIYAITDGIKSNELNVRCYVKTKEIKLDKTSVKVIIGKEEKLTASVMPENATYNEIKWQSSNPNIATVNNGVIKGIKEGTVTITAYNEEENVKSVCEVKVKSIPVQSISLDEVNVTLGVGQEYLIKETITPSNATYKDVIWTSSNNNIVTVNNGKIKATGEGSASITAKTMDGKEATCKFTVNRTAPENPIRYVMQDFNVRNGIGIENTKLGDVTLNDEIEILKEGSNWAKVRIRKNGIVGYTISKAYSTSKRFYISGVPYINQHTIGLPTGCEAVAATMAAKYSGYNVNVNTIIANTPTDTLGKRQEKKTKEIQEEKLNEETGLMETLTTTIEENIWVGENPFKYFVGHPTKYVSDGSYGCFASPIVTALRNSGVSCTDISGCSVSTLYSYIEQGKPVIVWCRARAQDLKQGVTWQYPDGSGEYVELVGEHCAVLIGYDADNIYLNDPAIGAGVSQPRWKFESNWYKLHSQAIIIN